MAISLNGKKFVIKGEVGKIREEIILSCKEVAGGEQAPIMECTYTSRLKDLETGEVIEQEDLVKIEIGGTAIAVTSDYIENIEKMRKQVVVELDNRWVKWGKK